MCGIVGAIAERDVTKILLTGLNRLEYRGYDSAGVALVNEAKELHRARTLGKVAKLEEALNKKPLHGFSGIAHTRWATHGVPAQNNAHPHVSGEEIALVHNGIIENHEALRKRLQKEGFKFDSETDTEVIVHLIKLHLKKTKDLLLAVKDAVKELKGAYALAILSADEPDRLIAVRQGSPLVIGIGVDEHFVASDALALLPVTQQFIYLEEDDIAEIKLKSVKIYDKDFKPVKRKAHISKLSADVVDKGEFRHFMLKEIFEQASAVGETLEGRIANHKVLPAIFGVKAEEVFEKVERVQIVACGTSYHAGLVARYWIEEFVGIPCQVEIASEIRYRQDVVQPNTLFVTISQSGETADTLAALSKAKKSKKYLASLTICNVPESSLMRESDLIFLTRAGTEIGVASTKAFTTQLTSLLLLTIALGRHHGLDEKTATSIVKQLETLPRQIEKALDLHGEIEELAKVFTDKIHALFLGRGIEYPIAMEGALKLKEISYIHAEAYPAGELKHGPLALVDKEMPVVTIVPNDHLLEKIKSNIEEVRARGGLIIAVIDEAVSFKTSHDVIALKVPSVDNVVAPILYTIPLQLLSYYVAVLKGTDIDQPRNLAKSVTVE